jgi:L-threonylcarbamoyladenylate synthase
MNQVSYLSEWHLNQAKQVLTAGGVIAYPTETVWGFGCIPTYTQAVERILEIKGRSARKGLIIIAANQQQLMPWVANLSEKQWQTLSTQTERPTTWIVPASERVPPLVTGGRATIAVRITSHPQIARLCSQVGPIVSTSANRSGKPVVVSRFQCIQQFASDVDWVLPGDCGSPGQSSRIVDMQTGQIIRP